MRATFRPLDWTAATTPAAERRSRYTFKAPWSSTLQLLDRELEHLDAENLVIQADFAERDLRMDGMPKERARQPEFPGVRILFDSVHGPLVYETDAYEFWQHNVRGIALGLEALRAVDRYGVTRHAEQYKGWKALGAGPSTPMPSGPGMTREDAAALIAEHAGGDPAVVIPLILAGDERTTLWWRMAARSLHPDAGGTAEAFHQLQRAKEVLGL